MFIYSWNFQVGAANCINSLRSQQRFYKAKTNTYVHFSNRETEARVWLCDLPTRKRKQRRWGVQGQTGTWTFRVGMLSLCGPRADTVSGVRNTVPVGSRGSSGVNACSIAGYGFCMEKKRSSKLKLSQLWFCDRRKRGAARTLARALREARKERCGQGKARERGRRTPTSCRLNGPDAPASIRALAARGGLSPSLPPAPPPRGPARAAAHLHNGGWSHERGERGLRERRIGRSALSCGAWGAPRARGRRTRARARGDPPLPEGSGLWSARSLASSEVHPSLLHSVPCMARGLFLSLGLPSLCGNNLWKHSNGNTFKWVTALYECSFFFFPCTI